MERSLVLVVLSQMTYLSTDAKSFIASFQLSEKWSKDEWLQFNDIIPSFNEFTACHWEKIKHFSDQINTVWSYCFYLTEEDQKMNCVEAYYQISSNIGRNIDFTGWIDGLSDVPLYIEFKKVPYDYKAWNHFCWTYSNKTGVNNLFHNGRKVSSVNLMDTYGTFGPSIPGSNFLYDSSFIVGQEPDSLRGDYSELQSFAGEIGELNIWNKILEEDYILNMASCSYSHKGNVVAWAKEKFDANLVKTFDIEDSSIFCKKKKVHAIFPQPISHQYGEKLCSRFGGTIGQPLSEVENVMFRSILTKHKNACVDDKNYKSSEKVKAIWLGAVRSGSTWYERSNSKPNKSSIIYSNWYGRYNLSASVDNPCPFMFFDGTWGYGREKICKSLKLCLLCSFHESPLFTLKGQSKKSMSNEWNYYFSINSSTQIEFFEGATKKSNISLRGMTWIKLSQSISERVDINTTSYPIGRHTCSWADENLGSSVIETGSCTFSVCTFGEEYTCSSGECVTMEKRCDTVYDCDDASDEDDCNHVLFPGSYKKGHAPLTLKRNDHTLYVGANIKIEKIDFIDTLKMKIGVTFVAQMTWKDQRLGYKNIHHYSSYSLSEAEGEKLWLPLHNLYHKHAIVGRIFTAGEKKLFVKGTKQDVIMSPHRSQVDFEFSGEHVNLTTVQRYRVEYNCLFDLQKYPFEKFSCDLGLKIEGKDHETFLLTGHPSTSVVYLDTKNIGDFRLVGVENNFNISLMNGIFGSSAKNGLSITIWIKRSSVDQIVSVFCPSILFWILAYCTMFLDIDDISNRSRTSVTVLLVLLSLLQTVKRDFPKTTYYKFIDIWFLWYIANIFAIIFYQILIPWMKSKVGQMMQCDYSQTQVFPLEMDHVLEKESKKIQNDLTMDVMKKVNKALSITFPILFFMFNIMYFFISS